MDIQSAKLQFIEDYLQLTDETIINKLAKVLAEEKHKVKKLVLSRAEKQAIKIGLKDISTGKVLSHDEVMKEMRSKYPTIVK